MKRPKIKKRGQGWPIFKKYLYVYTKISMRVPGCGDENNADDDDDAPLAVEEMRRFGLNFGCSLNGTGKEM